MTLEEARDCLYRDSCIGCKFRETDISCLEEAQEIGVKAIDTLLNIEKFIKEENK